MSKFTQNLQKQLKITIFILTLVLSATLLSTLTTTTFASVDFTINTNTKVTYSERNDYLTIKETVTIGVNNSNYYLPSGSAQTFEIPDFQLINDNNERKFKKESIKLKDKNGNDLSFTVSDKTNRILITTHQNRAVNPGEKFIFIFSYNTHELIEKTGNIYSIFVPGLAQDMQQIDKDDHGLTTQYDYVTTVEIEGKTPEISYIQPEHSALTPEYTEGKVTLSIPTQQRIGNTIWLQIGTKQYYHFKMVQNSPKTDTLTPDISNGPLTIMEEYLSTNIFELPLPKEHPETNQKVFISSITPNPKAIKRDEQGNLTAIFETPANESTEIIIEGYISLENLLVETEDMSLPEYFTTLDSNSSGLANYKQYTQSDKYWESNSTAIMEQAAILKAESSSILDLISADYEFVINHLEYSSAKLETESNIRTGALSAYNGAESVCMEYSDLAIAIFRAQGIPARAAVGYGNDPTRQENALISGELEKQEIGHQWVQVWLPNYGWYSVDPTWGESGRTYLGANLDHVLWLTMATAEDEILGATSISSADVLGSGELKAYEVYMEAMSQKEFDTINIASSAVELSDYVSDYKDLEYSDTSYFLKGTLAGRAVIFITPILGVILIVSILVMVVGKVFRGKYNKNKNSSTA